MKKVKNLLAVIFSVIFVMSIIPSAVFAGGIPDTLTVNYEEASFDYTYRGGLKLGKNSFPGISEISNNFFTFVPDKTGVYVFNCAILDGITSDTNDNICNADEFLEFEYFFSDTDEEIFGNYYYLTAGTMYFVLTWITEFGVDYLGTVTDIKPVIALNDLVYGYDIQPDEDGEDNGLLIRCGFEFKFSTNKSAYCNGYYFENGFYTNDTVTMSCLNFRKVIPYNAINMTDMVASMETKGRVDFIKYFDGNIELKKPVTVVIKFTNGKSVEVKIDEYWEEPEFQGTNGRSYPMGLYVDDYYDFCIYTVDTEFESNNYTIKKAGLFRNISYYIMCKFTLFSMYRYEAKYEHGLKNKYNVWVDYLGEVNHLRTELLKSIFSFQ